MPGYFFNACQKEVLRYPGLPESGHSEVIHIAVVTSGLKNNDSAKNYPGVKKVGCSSELPCEVLGSTLSTT